MHQRSTSNEQQHLLIEIPTHFISPTVGLWCVRVSSHLVTRNDWIQ